MADESISITLSPMQVEHVVRAAARAAPSGVASLVADRLAASQNGDGRRSPRSRAAGAAPAHPRDALDVEAVDPRLSRSLLRGLSILTRFGPDAPERGIVELAQELGMSASTAHRYAQTLIQLGLLERCPTTRKYRLPAR